MQEHPFSLSFFSRFPGAACPRTPVGADLPLTGQFVHIAHGPPSPNYWIRPWICLSAVQEPRPSVLVPGWKCPPHVKHCSQSTYRNVQVLGFGDLPAVSAVMSQAYTTSSSPTYWDSVRRIYRNGSENINKVQPNVDNVSQLKPLDAISTWKGIVPDLWF